MAVQLQFTPQYAFAAGVFESGAQARFYESSTTTPETVYSDEALSTAHPSPLVADANGQFATVWGADGVNVKVVVTKADDGALFTLDKVILGNTAIGNAAGVSFSPTTENPNTNVQAAVQANAVARIAGDVALTDGLALKAPLAAPVFTGIPAAPTAATTTDTTQIATTAFVQQEILAAVPGPSLRFAVQFSANGTIADSFNVTSVVRNSTGDYTITPATNPGNDDWYATVTTTGFSGSDEVTINSTTLGLVCKNLSNSAVNSTQTSVMGFW